MQPVKRLVRVLSDLADSEHYLFTLDDLQGALPDQSRGAFKAMVSCAQRDGLLWTIGAVRNSISLMLGCCRQVLYGCEKLAFGRRKCCVNSDVVETCVELLVKLQSSHWIEVQ